MLIEIKSLNILNMSNKQNGTESFVMNEFNALKRITETEVKFITIQITETETKKMHVRK